MGIKDIADYIDEAAEKVGSANKLAARLGLRATVLSDTKAHRRTLPLDAVVVIAGILEEPAVRVIAANELATEHKEEKRKFWENFRQAPVMGLAGTGLSGAAALAYNWSAATDVTKFVTLLPAKAPIYAALEAARFVLC